MPPETGSPSCWTARRGSRPPSSPPATPGRSPCRSIPCCAGRSSSTTSASRTSAPRSWSRASSPSPGAPRAEPPRRSTSRCSRGSIGARRLSTRWAAEPPAGWRRNRLRTRCTSIRRGRRDAPSACRGRTASCSTRWRPSPTASRSTRTTRFWGSSRCTTRTGSGAASSLRCTAARRWCCRRTGSRSCSGGRARSS